MYFPPAPQILQRSLIADAVALRAPRCRLCALPCFWISTASHEGYMLPWAQIHGSCISVVLLSVRSSPSGFQGASHVPHVSHYFRLPLVSLPIMNNALAGLQVCGDRKNAKGVMLIPAEPDSHRPCEACRVLCTASVFTTSSASAHRGRYALTGPR